MRYYAAMIKQRVQKTTGVNPLKLNMDWPSIKMDADGTWPPLNPNWFKQQELMAKVGPFMAGMGMTGGGGGGGAQQAASSANAAPAAPKEEVVEKSHFDIELTSYDAKNKIKIIKEIRGLFNLGLKEAKDLVEACPANLKKEVKKEDVENIQKVLEPLGVVLKIA